MKRVIRAAMAIAIVLVLICSFGQADDTGYNGNVQPCLRDSAVIAEYDFHTATGGLIVWHPFY